MNQRQDQQHDRKQAAYQRILDWDMPDKGDVSAARAIAVATWLALPTTVVGLVVGWLALGWIAHRALVTWVAALAGPVVGLAVVLFLVGRGSRRRLRAGLLAVLAEGVLFAWVVTLLLGSTRATETELRAALDGVHIPYAVVQGSENVEGNRRCKPECTVVSRVYKVPAQRGEDPPTLFLQALARDGWTPPEGGDVSKAVSVVKGNVDLSPAPTSNRDEVRLEATSTG
ncbi:MAG TPA: hypothetical protein VF486_24400 [Actinomycetes bacterium]